MTVLAEMEKTFDINIDLITIMSLERFGALAVPPMTSEFQPQSRLGEGKKARNSHRDGMSTGANAVDAFICH